MSETVKRVQFTPQQKRKIIIYPETHGNKKAGQEYAVPENNVRLWSKHRDAIFRYEPKLKNFRG